MSPAKEGVTFTLRGVRSRANASAVCQNSFLSEPCPVIRHPQPRRSICLASGLIRFRSAPLGLLQKALH